MGVAISRMDDTDLYKDTYEEAQRIIRISDELRMSLEKVSASEPEATKNITPNTTKEEKLTTSKLAKKLGMSTKELLASFVEKGYLEIRDGNHYLTDAGKETGGKFMMGKHGAYFIWGGGISGG